MSTAPIGPSRRSRVLGITLAIVVVLIFVFFATASIYADVLWFDQLGFLGVFASQWGYRLAAFGLGFVAMAIPVWASLFIAYRTRPVYAKLNTQLDHYQELFEPLRKLVMWGVPVLLGLFAGVATAAGWESLALWLARESFGTADPQFGLDQGFYVFELPFYQGVVALASAVLILSTLLVIGVNYIYGGIRIQGRALVIAKSARVQIAILAGLYLLFQGLSFWLDQYATVTSSNELFTGANYTDVNATIPGLNIMAAAALVVALLFFVAAVIGRWRLPLVATAVLIVTALVVGTVYPWIVQRFQVDPNAKSLETPFIQRNIDETRSAFGVAGIEVIDYDAVTTAEPGALKNDAATTASLRLMDPSVISPAFSQLQQFKQYYAFPEVLDIDRYVIDGQNQDTVTAVRDLNIAGLGGGATWFNEHLVYTHGYGLVMAAGNQRSVDGQPVFLEGGIPTSGVLEEFQARVYFGENSPTYSIVGAPEGTTAIELDYAASGADAESAQAKYTFTGDGGPALDNVFNRLVYALKFQSEQILLSDAITSESQILYDRNPLQRVQKVAPYLTLDSDPYPSVVDGRLVWIVDGYTTADKYAYSTPVSWQDAISDSATPSPFPSQQVNYVRNSVKATVDAYDGSVTLYAWDSEEPILKAWQKVYPSTLKPVSEMSGDLLSHVRYPSDLFRAQREILEQYHVTDAGSFYSKDDAWTTPNDPTTSSASGLLQPPYYLTLQMPTQETPTFSLYTTFIPDARGETSRNVLKGYLAADSNAGNTDGTVAEEYGKLRLLTLPEGDAVPGPGQVQAKFNADPSVSTFLNLLKQGQSEVINGNLLTVPVGGGLLYVQPVFVKSTGETSYPLLQKVLVAFGDEIAFEDTLDEALDTLFGGNSGAEAGDAVVDPEATPAPEEGGSGEAPSADRSAQVSALLAEASSLVTQKQAALEAGDLVKFAEIDAQLTAVISQLVQLVG